MKKIFLTSALCFLLFASAVMSLNLKQSLADNIFEAPLDPVDVNKIPGPVPTVLPPPPPFRPCMAMRCKNGYHCVDCKTRGGWVGYCVPNKLAFKCPRVWLYDLEVAEELIDSRF
jgi:hypothetical protein